MFGYHVPGARSSLGCVCAIAQSCVLESAGTIGLELRKNRGRVFVDGEGEITTRTMAVCTNLCLEEGLHTSPIREQLPVQKDACDRSGTKRYSQHRVEEEE